MYVGGGVGISFGTKPPGGTLDALTSASLSQNLELVSGCYVPIQKWQIRTSVLGEITSNNQTENSPVDSWVK